MPIPAEGKVFNRRITVLGDVIIGKASQLMKVLDNNGNVYRKTTPTTITTAAAVTYTGAQFLAGLILRDPNGAGRSDVTPTAALMRAAVGRPAFVGQTVEFVIRNTADAAETITMTAGTGVTLSGTMTIAQNNTKRFQLVFTNVTPGQEAATLFSIGTMVH